MKKLTKEQDLEFSEFLKRSKMKKVLLFIIISTILFSCSSDKISEKSIELNNKAVSCITAQKFDDALKFANEAIKADVKNYNAYTIKAQMLIKQNKLNDAEKTMREQLKIKPDFAEGWSFKGIINDLIGNEKQAMSDYERGIELFENRIAKSEYNKQINITNEYMNLLLMNTEDSKRKMLEIENKYKNDQSIYNFLTAVKKQSKDELIKQFLIE